MIATNFHPIGERYRQALSGLNPASPKFAMEAVDQLLTEAKLAGAGDIHLNPTPEGLEAFWRIDGVLHQASLLPKSTAPNVVARLKVLADLLTYRTDIPQEGRIRNAPGSVELRVSTFPTLHGEKAVIRIFGKAEQYQRLADLGLPTEIESSLFQLLGETSGMVLITGPAGSGKTTTFYACLRELTILTQGQRCLATLEDPIEVAAPGVNQSQIQPTVGFDFETGLRSLMRQDPEVIGVGEIRDQATARVAFQAALTGHLVISTFHAGSASGALGRLADMEIEPYVLRSGLLAVISQRLVRKLCSECSLLSTNPETFLGLAVDQAKIPQGCPACRGTGYHGRTLIAELLTTRSQSIARAILDRRDVSALETAAKAGGMVSRMARACQAVNQGITSPAEVRRAFGFTDD